MFKEKRIEKEKGIKQLSLYYYYLIKGDILQELFLTFSHLF